MKSYSLPVVVSLLSLASTAYSHAVITNVAGANGVSGQAFGFIADTPRDGTDEQPFQTDTSVLKNLIADPCGHTLAGGSINIAQSLAKSESAGLPSLANDLSVTMTLHQVNGDGGGPFTAMFNTDGKGLKWSNATVLVQAPGENGLLAGGPFDSKFVAQLPAGTKCTGGTSGNACLVRISNGGSAADGAGPFGGCVAVAAAGTGGTASNSTAATTATTATKTSKNNNNANKNNRNGRRHSRFFQRSYHELMKRVLTLSPADANDLITAAGSALNIPIDALAGLDDNNPNGGNSTKPAKNALLTTQQAIDLEVAVKDAVSKAIEMMATGRVTPTAGAVATQVNAANPDRAISANEEMTSSFTAGLATHISKAVGQPDGTAIINNAAAQATASAPTATRNKNAAAATATAAATGNRKNGNNGNRPNFAGFGNNRNGNGNRVNHSQAREVVKRRVRSRVMRALVNEDEVY